MPQKKIKVNKNRKKTWRKFGDVLDVESFLEQKRLEERSGGPINTKADNELYYIDQNKPIKRILKSECFLNSLNNFPPISKSFKKQPPKTRRALHHAHKRLLKRKKYETHQEKKLNDKKLHNIWGKNDKTQNTSILKPSKLKAIIYPHPGLSYNPTFGDHQNLLAEIVKKDIQQDKYESKIIKNTSIKNESSKNIEDMRFKEMCEGLPLDASEAKFNVDLETQLVDLLGTLNTNKGDEILSPKTNMTVKISRDKKKSRSKKRKLGQLKIQQKLRKDKTVKSNILKDIDNVKKIKKEILQVEDKKNAIKKKKSIIGRIRNGRITKRLGKHKFQESQPVFKLGEELPARIKDLKPEGDILLDCFKSLQRRNMIEVSSRHAQNSYELNDARRIYTDRNIKNRGNKKRLSKS